MQYNREKTETVQEGQGERQVVKFVSEDGSANSA